MLRAPYGPGRRIVALAAVIALLLSGEPRPATAAASSGAASTTNVLIGVGTIYSYVTYRRETMKADNDALAAVQYAYVLSDVRTEIITTLRAGCRKSYDPKDPKCYATPSDDDIYTKLKKLSDAKADVICATGPKSADCKNKVTTSFTKAYDEARIKRNGLPAWRDGYATLNACWNSLIYTENIPDGSMCVPDTMLPPYQNYDLMDLSDSFKKAPSLLKQIGDADVGTYKYENKGRSGALLQAAYWFLNFYFPLAPPPPPKPLTGSSPPPAADLVGGATTCLFTPDATKCLTAIGKASSDAASAYRRHVACKFGRDYALPTVTAIRVSDAEKKPGAPTAMDFGDVPGC